MYKRYLILLFFVFYLLKVQAQLGFCSGNSGDPIFVETFGSGKNQGTLPMDSSSGYRNKYGQPENGYYTISPSTFGWFDWFNIGDHTVGDTQGKMLIVNAASRPGEFFEIQVSGLCENTTYEFSSWLINLLPSSFSCRKKVPINVRFEIWDSTNSTKLKSGDTGNIYSSTLPKWQQYGLVFQTKPGQTSVILKMRNNGVGGCGNDLAIDDIMFRTCGDAVVITDSANNMKNARVYKDELPYSSTLKANPDFSVFSTHFYQWQESFDGVNWKNIPLQNTNSYTVTKVFKTSYYRVLVSESEINLLNSLCNSASEIFKVNLVNLENPNKPPKKVIKSKRKNVKPISLNKKELKEVPAIHLKKHTKSLKLIPKNLTNTYKKVIIVINGLTIIKNKVWIDGAIGKYIKTSEEIIKKGDTGAGVIIEETIYSKAKYGYNSKKRIYKIPGLE